MIEKQEVKKDEGNPNNNNNNNLKKSELRIASSCRRS